MNKSDALIAAPLSLASTQMNHQRLHLLIQLALMMSKTVEPRSLSNQTIHKIPSINLQVLRKRTYVCFTASQKLHETKTEER